MWRMSIRIDVRWFDEALVTEVLVPDMYVLGFVIRNILYDQILAVISTRVTPFTWCQPLSSRPDSG
jgi:hypothetical protein